MENLSIVVPIYNKAEYLEESLDSLLKDSSDGIEFLLIDDCSKDNSLEIAKEYAKKDSRIRVFQNKYNCGVSNTRNKGIMESRGKYVGFFDADDLVDPGFYQLLYQTACRKQKPQDIVVGGFECIQPSHVKIDINTLPFVLEKVPFVLQRNRFVGCEPISCCNKIYLKEFLSGKYFPDYIKEDTYFHYWAFHEARRVSDNRSTTYYYRNDRSERNNSYYERANGNFNELVKGYNWVSQKVGYDDSYLLSLRKLQCLFFKSYLSSIIDWTISFEDKIELIGTIITYCIQAYPEMSLEILPKEVLEFYRLYPKKSKDISLETSEKKMSLLASNYPRRRK